MADHLHINSGKKEKMDFPTILANLFVSGHINREPLRVFSPIYCTYLTNT